MKRFNRLFEERGEKAYKQAIDMGLKYGGFGYWKNAQGEVVYKTENDTLVPVEPKEESELADKRAEPGPGGERGQLPGMPGGGPGMQGGPGGPGGGGGPGAPMAGQGIQGAPDPGREKARPLRSWNPGPDGDTCVGPDSQDPGAYPTDSFVGRTNYMNWRAGPDGDNITTGAGNRVMGEAVEMPKPPVKDKNPKLEQQNKEIKGMVANPDYDLKQSGKKLGAGSYGTTHMASEKHNGKNVIIKQGEIFDNELKALNHFSGEEGFPELVNAEINRPWRQVGSQGRAQNIKGEDGKVKTYGGTIAMEAVGDMELDDAFRLGAVDDMDQAAEDLWSLKKKLHTQGWYHGDLHDANVRWDTEAQKPAMIDFGKAQQNPHGALFEALGSRNGKDVVQGTVNPWNEGYNKVGLELQNRIEDNFQKVRQRAIEMSGLDPETDKKQIKMLEQSLQGGNADIMEDFLEDDKEDFPFLANDDNIYELINMFYDGIGEKPDPKAPSAAAMNSVKPKLSLADRMAAAYDRNFNHDD